MKVERDADLKREQSFCLFFILGRNETETLESVIDKDRSKEESGI